MNRSRLGGLVATWAAAAISVMAGCSSSNFGFGGSSSKVEPVRTQDTALPRAVIPGIAGEPDIRVRLLNGVSSTRVGSTGGVVWVSVIGDPRPPARMVAPVTIKLNSRVWELADAAGLTGQFGRDSDLLLTAQGESRPGGVSAGGTPAYGYGAEAAGAKAGAAVLTLDGKRYPGTMTLTGRSDVGMWAFDAIEQVGVEDYTKGVVAAEMYTHWPLNAYSAQAVAARSYALHERQRARLLGAKFDVENNVRDQAYNGSEYSPQVWKAVDQTRGVVLTWNGTVLRAYYSSTSGGRPASAKDTWPTGRGYEYNLAGPLQAQPREELGQSSPTFRWTATRSRGELSRRVRAWGTSVGHPVKSLGTVRDVRTSERNVVGRPSKFDIVDTSGQTFSLTAEQLRQACNQNASGFEAVSKANRVHSGDIEFSVVGEVVTITGRGMGHGVGMCQWSAKELGDRGVDWKAILTRFYPGAKVERAY